MITRAFRPAAHDARIDYLIPTLTEISATKGIQELLDPDTHPLGHSSHDVTAHNLFGSPTHTDYFALSPSKRKGTLMPLLGRKMLCW
jgi:hypothetical protein